MGDSNGRFRIFDRRLRRHAAGPEHGNLTLVEINRLAVVRLHHIGNADLGGIAHVDGRAVDIRHFDGDVIRLFGVFRRHGAHGADHRTAERAGRLGHDIDLEHRHIASLRDVPDLDALAHERFLKRERAANQEADIALLPVAAYVGQLLAVPLTVAVDAVFGNVGANVAALAHVVGFGRTTDDLENGAGEGVAPGKFLKISRIFRRQDDEVGLRVAAAHTGGGEVDDALADELAHLARLHIDIRCNIKGHVSFLLLLLFFAF